MKQSIIILFLSSYLFCEEYHKLFYEANEMYISENYNRSIEIYESIINSDRTNSAVFYNLGNSYFRLKKIGQAIWAYRYASMLNPRDKDIIHNLNIAETYKIDRINQPRSFFFHEFYKKIKYNYTIIEWLIMGSLLFLLLSILSFYRSFYDKRSRSLINISQVFVIFIIIIHSITLDKYFQEKKIANEGIIIKKVDARSGPLLGSNKVLFQINEGSMVEVLEEKNNWSQVILMDGKKGWVVTKSIRKMK
tara:strand:+ start:822 stop:1568 length:747 start_codon:yes stop_codon:yes gene_type:complete